MKLQKFARNSRKVCFLWADPFSAILFLRWVTDTEQGVVPIARANGAIPGRFSAFDAFPEYDSPPWSVFRAQLEQHGRPRPRTPHYPAVTRNVAEALRDIANGADPAATLDRAAGQIQAVLDR